jgi:AcrR family transcriptional regulator
MGGDDPLAARIAAAMVEVVSEHGYPAANVDAVCERAGVRRTDFELRFADVEDCFLRLHDQACSELMSRIASACSGASSWHDRVWAAGWAAMRFLQEDPQRARFLVVAVNHAGAAAQARRDRALQAIAGLIDSGRMELPEPDSISRCTAEIVSGAIYNTVLAKVAAGSIERGEGFLPELVYMAVMPYLGSQAAEDELLVQPLR